MKKKEKRTLFRKEAIDAQGFERLNSLLIVVGPKGWIALLCFSFLILSFLIWSIVGKIPIDVHGKAIVLKKTGNFVLEASEEGRVENIFIQEGDIVEKGELLLKMKSLQKELHLKNALSQKKLLEMQLNQFSKDHKKKIYSKIKALNDDILSQEWEIYRLEKEVEFLLKDLEWKKNLYEEGLLALPTINEAKEKIHEKQNAIDSANTKILENQAELKSLSNVLDFQHFQSSLKQAQDEIEQGFLEEKELKIKSPRKGRVLSILRKDHEQVKKGEKLFWLESLDEEKEPFVVYGYFSSSRDQTIREGMLAFANLNNVDIKKYGQLLLRVKRVWSFPVSSREVFNIIGNQNLVRFLLSKPDEAPIQVLFEPIKNANTVSGYSWTSRKGPPFTIDTGTVGRITVRTETRRPIEYIFPIFREIEESVEENP